MKLCSLAVFCELGGQDRLDMFRLLSDEVALTSSGVDSNCVRNFRGGLGLHDILEVLEDSVFALCFSDSVHAQGHFCCCQPIVESDLGSILTSDWVSSNEGRSHTTSPLEFHFIVDLDEDGI